MFLKAIFFIIVGGAAVFITAWCVNGGLCLYQRLVSRGIASGDIHVVQCNSKSPSDSSPILFVHGAWHGAWCWEEHFLPYFADRGYDAYALDLRGHGKSSGRDRLPFTRVTDYVDDVIGAIDTLPVPPIIVGHSMGGLVVQKALEKKNLPAGVLLVPVPKRGVLGTTLRIARRHPIAFFMANLKWSLFPIIGSPALTRDAFFSSDMPEEDLNRYFEQMQDESYLGFLDMLMATFSNPDAVSTPMLVLGAENDRVFTAEEVHDTATRYGTEAVICKGMAHDMMLERDWQDVADRILEWLKASGL